MTMAFTETPERIKKLIHDYQKYNEITAELEGLNNQLEELMMEWEELSEEMNA